MLARSRDASDSSHATIRQCRGARSQKDVLCLSEEYWRTLSIDAALTSQAELFPSTVITGVCAVPIAATERKMTSNKSLFIRKNVIAQLSIPANPRFKYSFGGIIRPAAS